MEVLTALSYKFPSKKLNIEEYAHIVAGFAEFNLTDYGSECGIFHCFFRRGIFNYSQHIVDFLCETFLAWLFCLLGKVFFYLGDVRRDSGFVEFVFLKRVDSFFVSKFDFGELFLFIVEHFAENRKIGTVAVTLNFNIKIKGADSRFESIYNKGVKFT